MTDHVTSPADGTGDSNRSVEGSLRDAERKDATQDPPDPATTSPRTGGDLGEASGAVGRGHTAGSECDNACIKAHDEDCGPASTDDDDGD